MQAEQAKSQNEKLLSTVGFDQTTFGSCQTRYPLHRRSDLMVCILKEIICTYPTM